MGVIRRPPKAFYNCLIWSKPKSLSSLCSLNSTESWLNQQSLMILGRLWFIFIRRMRFELRPAGSSQHAGASVSLRRERRGKLFIRLHHHHHHHHHRHRYRLLPSAGKRRGTHNAATSGCADDSRCAGRVIRAGSGSDSSLAHAHNLRTTDG